MPIHMEKLLESYEMAERGEEEVAFLEEGGGMISYTGVFLDDDEDDDDDDSCVEAEVMRRLHAAMAGSGSSGSSSGSSSTNSSMNSSAGTTGATVSPAHDADEKEACKY